MRVALYLAALAVGFRSVQAQTPTQSAVPETNDIATDDGTYTLESAKGDTVNENIGTNEGASTSVTGTGGDGSDGQDIGGHGNIVSGGQINSDGSYNGYGNLNHDINSSYNGNTIINNYATAPQVTCIGDWCIEDPPCTGVACKHQRVIHQDGIYQTEPATDDSWDRLVSCEGSRCHYNRCYDEECEQKIVCANGQCNRQQCQGDECLRKLVCKDGQCQHEACEVNECGNRYNFVDGDKYEISPTCKGAKCPRPALPSSAFTAKVQGDVQLHSGGGHPQQITVVVTLNP